MLSQNFIGISCFAQNEITWHILLLPAFFSFFPFLVNDLHFSISTHFISSNNKPYLHYTTVSKTCFLAVYPNLNLIQDCGSICLLCPIAPFNLSLFFMTQICWRGWASCPASLTSFFFFFLISKQSQIYRKVTVLATCFSFRKHVRISCWHDAPSHPDISLFPAKDLLLHNHSQEINIDMSLLLIPRPPSGFSSCPNDFL